MMLETDLVPFSVSVPPGERVLVFAPHPDDETLGMGGSLRLLSENGKKIKVVVLTKGEKADPDTRDLERYAHLRKKETLMALKVLGITDYIFLEFPDRELDLYRSDVEGALRAIVDDFAPDVIYSPSIVEIHPDHRVTAELSVAIKQKTDTLKCLFYEIVTPIRPNILVDITKVFHRKKKAIKCYKTQLRINDYLHLLTCLNTYRSFTLGKNVKYAEAFWEISQMPYENMTTWLNYKDPLKLQ